MFYLSSFESKGQFISKCLFGLFVCLLKKRTVTSDRHFLLQCIHTNKFISYSGSQLYMAASFSTKESQQTRRRVVGGPFNGRPLPEQFDFRPGISGKCEHSRNLIHCRESCLFIHSSVSFYQVWYRTYPQQSNGHNFTQYIRSNTNKHPYFRSIQVCTVHCAPTCGRGNLCVKICVCESAYMQNCALAHLRGQKSVWDARVVENLSELK